MQVRTPAAEPMRLLVLGATGRTGRALLGQARARGHRVTALVRSTKTLGDVGDITVRQGDPCNVGDVTAALANQDVVVSALGHRGLGRSTVLGDAARAAVSAMEATGVRRLLVVSVGLLFDGAPAIALFLRRTVLRHVASDSRKMEEIVESSGLDWTIVRPPRLTDGPPTGTPSAADDRLPPDSRASMSRKDLASFLLDEVEGPRHMHRIVGLSTPLGRWPTFAYWLATLILGVECIGGGISGGFRAQPFARIIVHLGYPAYLMALLGIGYVLAGLAVLAPRLPRLKEWAYAGLFFNYTGAAVSHLVTGDGAGIVITPLVFAGLAMTSWALRPSGRRALERRKASVPPDRIRTLAYWAFTLIVAWEMAAGSMWDLLRIEYVRTLLAHLGYPPYLLFILGAWKLPCAVALLVPRFPRLKEWAYAGAVFNYLGATLSHLFVGDGSSRWVPPLLFTALTFASWALRPPDRRYPLERAAGGTRPGRWILSVALVAVFVFVSLLTLPSGAS